MIVPIPHTGRRLLVVAAGLLLAACLANAAHAAHAPQPAQTHRQFTEVYYVATTGSDRTGDGSEADPWATIGHAIEHVVDGSLILVKPGTYYGRVHLDARFDTGVTIRSAVPYQARLRNDSRVIVCFYGQGITLEGFDIAHNPPLTSDTVIQIQDLLGPTNGPGDGEVVSDIVLRNNVIHDSYDNDLVKINNGAVDILIEGNMFYNQAGVDEHLDINSVKNVVIQNNIFFNDYAGSGRPVDDLAQTFIAIKDSAGDADDFVGARDVVVRRNVFLNFQGRNDGNFIQVGSDEAGYFGAFNVLIENNLMLGNSDDQMRAAFGVISARDVTIRYNTVVGDLPAMAYAMRLFGIHGPDSKDIRFYGNIWADPTGTMRDFSDSPPGDTVSFVLEGNLYWNGGNPIPVDPSDLVAYTDDPMRVVGDPRLPDQAGLVVPRWQPAADQFADGSETIHEAFVRLVNRYGIPAPGSAAIDAGSGHCPATDLRGLPRPSGGGCDLGAIEVGADACAVGENRLVVDHARITGDTEYAACRHITLGPDVRIVEPAHVKARAGLSIALTSGFSVDEGATFRAVIDPAIAPAKALAVVGTTATGSPERLGRTPDSGTFPTRVNADQPGAESAKRGSFSGEPKAMAKAGRRAGGVPVPALGGVGLVLLSLLIPLAGWYWSPRLMRRPAAVDDDGLAGDVARRG